MKMQSNNRDIVGAVYVRRRGNIIGIFIKAGLSMADAEDMAQDVFVRMLRVDILNSETADAMAVTIAYNMLKDYFRKRRFATAALDAAAHIKDEGYETSSMAVCRDIERMEDTAVGNLTTKEANVYKMSRNGDMTTTEISQIMGISKRTVENHIYNARRIVRKYIAEAL